MTSKTNLSNSDEPLKHRFYNVLYSLAVLSSEIDNDNFNYALPFVHLCRHYIDL